MSDFPSLELTDSKVDELLSQAKRADDGTYVTEINEDHGFASRTEFDISHSGWVSVDDDTDPFGSARAIKDRNLHDPEEDEEVFLRIGGTLTTSGKDLNGVAIAPSALTTIPQDLSDRTTLLFNHRSDTPIGRIVNTRVIRARGGKPARGVITADVHRDAVNIQTQMTFADSIRSGVLSKYSFAWHVIRGTIVFDLSEGSQHELDEEAETLTFKFGSEFAPEITVFALRATEASVVSVPALSDAEITLPRQFARALGSRWTEQDGLLVPVASLSTERGPRNTDSFDFDTQPGGIFQILPINRPFNAELAAARIQDWANEDEEEELFPTSLNKSLLHYDVVDGKLVSNLRALRSIVRGFTRLEFADEEERTAAKQALRQAYVNTHGFDLDDVPHVLKD